VTNLIKRKDLEHADLSKREADILRGKDKVEKELTKVQSKLGIAYGNLDLANKKVDAEKDQQKKLEASIAEIIKKKDEAERSLG
jgi:hypothetical protein